MSTTTFTTAATSTNIVITTGRKSTPGKGGNSEEGKSKPGMEGNSEERKSKPGKGGNLLLLYVYIPLLLGEPLLQVCC